jgi:peptidoglycan/xylan/chitin deacetylase (PgdA/CDA1 family)
MAALHALKLMAYWTAARGGFFTVAGNSEWRRKRLLILCYHGISLYDEHRWNPSLYITAALLRRRLEALRRSGCSILPLAEALERLRKGALPRRSVAITFDDGFHDFYREAAPVLHEYRAPATVYVSTYYSYFNRPVFDPMLSYLLWRGAGQTLTWPEALDNRMIPLTPENLGSAWREISRFASESGLSGKEKDALLAELANRLGVDYEDICSRRILQLMNPDELRAIAARGFDLQLHTHRHRMPKEKKLFVKEIEDNRAALAHVSSSASRHFCYPSGVCYPESEDLLRECGIVSATTCEPGWASPSSSPYSLARFCDSTSTRDLVFEAWTSGAAGLLPHRRGGKVTDRKALVDPPASAAAEVRDVPDDCRSL